MIITIQWPEIRKDLMQKYWKNMQKKIWNTKLLQLSQPQLSIYFNMQTRFLVQIHDFDQTFSTRHQNLKLSNMQPDFNMQTKQNIARKLMQMTQRSSCILQIPAAALLFISSCKQTQQVSRFQLLVAGLKRGIWADHQGRKLNSKRRKKKRCSKAFGSLKKNETCCNFS